MGVFSVAVQGRYVGCGQRSAAKQGDAQGEPSDHAYPPFLRTLAGRIDMA